MISPSRWRSSGTWAIPRARRDCPSEKRPVRSISSPLTRTCPVPFCIPPSTCKSSLCPLPETPAIPRISPARTLSEMPLSRSTPLLSVTRRSWTSSTVSLGAAGFLSTRSKTLRPTMSSANCSGLVSEVFTVAVIWPRRMTLTVSVISMISRSLWVIRMMVLPSSRRRLRMRKSWSASAGVSTPVGSSRMRISALR